MFYQPGLTPSGLPHNPFKSCCVPRPIGWISTVSRTGLHNLAPYSQFQNLTWDPPMVMVAVNCRPDGTPKDTALNAIETGEFVWNMATYAQREDVVRSSADLERGVNEFEACGIASLPATLVKPLRVANSPAHFECRLTQSLFISARTPEAGVWLLIGEVIGVHIAESALGENGLMAIERIQPLARLGYRDYTCVDKVFSMDLARLSGRSEESIAFLKDTIRK